MPESEILQTLYSSIAAVMALFSMFFTRTFACRWAPRRLDAEG